MMATRSASGLVLLALAGGALLGCSSKKGGTDEGGDKNRLREVSLTEAKTTVLEIARDAKDAFERERVSGDLLKEGEGDLTPTHKLCKSAAPVPAGLPSEGQRLPSTLGEWAQGDDETGWKCLHFALSQDTSRFRYSYIQGGPYLGASRGGVDPGPNGVEICAEADFTKGGDTTLVCLTGTADPFLGTIKLATEAVVINEK